MKTNRLVLLLSTSLALLSITPALSQSYDLSRDFSIAANPNGVWSYGWKTTIDGAFTRLTVTRTGSAGEENWGLAPGQLPVIYHNPSTTITNISDGGLGNYPPGTVWFNAGWDGWPQNFCVIRFTVPDQGGGTYLLESAVRAVLDGAASKDADYHVVVNNVEVFSQDLAPNSATGYTNNFNLAVGDTVDFMTGRGPDGVQYGSGLKIQATLSHPAICTPHKARATAQWVNEFVVGATITDGGCGYTNAPLVLVQGGGGTGATATAVVVDGVVTAIKMVSAGCCYTSTPKIVIASPPFVPTVNM